MKWHFADGDQVPTLCRSHGAFEKMKMKVNWSDSQRECQHKRNVCQHCVPPIFRVSNYRRWRLIVCFPQHKFCVFSIANVGCFSPCRRRYCCDSDCIVYLVEKSVSHCERKTRTEALVNYRWTLTLISGKPSHTYGMSPYHELPYVRFRPILLGISKFSSNRTNAARGNRKVSLHRRRTLTLSASLSLILSNQHTDESIFGVPLLDLMPHEHLFYLNNWTNHQKMTHRFDGCIRFTLAHARTHTHTHAHAHI